jgi:glycosyltransferase involved in cell wall biosynthesis
MPVVLSVGSLEPRKNHLGILFAAETLWREGLRFKLRFIGGSGWGDEVPRRIAALRAAGRDIELDRSVTAAELDRAYRHARFTVFPSLHEGFGLPIVESLSHATPVITSNLGSMREIANSGGALVIDPTDDFALVDAMRVLLTDESMIAALRQQAGNRPLRTWEQYASELWDNLVAPLIPSRDDQVTVGP